MKTRQDAINEGLDHLADLGFTMEQHFSEHGPMVIEAISDLGEIDEVTTWVDVYKRHWRHNPPPAPQKRVAGTQTDRFEGALGDYKRTTDWLAFFRNQLSNNSWQHTIKAWTPILMPGYFGGLTHGLIRTAYAVRSFPADGRPSELELDELAHGLAYWAGTYTELPGNPDHHDGQSIHDALQELPRVERGDAAGPGKGPEILAELSNFADTVESIPKITDVSAAISRHTALFARLLLTHPEVMPVPLVHCITAPAAMRTLLSFFDEDFGAWAYGRLWQVSSAIVALFAKRRKNSELDPEFSEAKFARDELIRRAVRHRDEHVIKLTEACLREDAIQPDPIYRVAAEAVIERVSPWF